MKREFALSRGFTLVELLIVVVVLGILAAAVIPQFSSSTDDARLATLDMNLAELRSSVELFYHQHVSFYPGAKKETDGSDVATAAEAATAFVKQLTLYTDLSGKTSTTKSATYKFGPYIKRAMPVNPFTSLNSLKCDISTTDVTTAASDGTTGWLFYIKTGTLIANDGSHDSR
jgi:prepilin-type N-terminal cleavage/methylation domain-containing protein